MGIDIVTLEDQFYEFKKEGFINIFWKKLVWQTVMENQVLLMLWHQLGYMLKEVPPKESGIMPWCSNADLIGFKIPNIYCIFCPLMCQIHK